MKKGFTLIELLAVIVILAIIALIAVPIISKVVSKSRKSAAIDSTYGYIESIENQIVLNEINKKNDNLKDGTYDLKDLKVNYKGKGPDEGMVVIEDSKVKEAKICIGEYSIDYIDAKANISNNNYCNIESDTPFNNWLKYEGYSIYNYATVDDLVADENALSKLLGNKDAMDFLLDNTEILNELKSKVSNLNFKYLTEFLEYANSSTDRNNDMFNNSLPTYISHGGSQYFDPAANACANWQVATKDVTGKNYTKAVVTSFSTAIHPQYFGILVSCSARTCNNDDQTGFPKTYDISSCSTVHASVSWGAHADATVTVGDVYIY